MTRVKVVGAGLAGCETAYYLANKGIKVDLFDIKPALKTPAHKSDLLGELVCSNSLKSNDVYGNACGLLKEEMRLLGSLVIAAADACRVPAGDALAVDREKFAQVITDIIKSHENITVHSGEVTEINPDEYTVIATGPLTTDTLSYSIKKLVGDGLHFYDASAPIVDKASIDMEHAFFGDRYGKGDGDHLNCPLTREEYDEFIKELKSARRADLHDFEKNEVFEGCMPIEIMASRGDDTLRFGPLKPVGLDDPKTGRWPYACLQLRRENTGGDMFNLVGFQTNLAFGEQKRVFGIIPALKNAEYLRYGVMHRNTFINSPKALNPDLSAKAGAKTFFAGQITGVEGYVESAASGITCARYLTDIINGRAVRYFPQTTVIGALSGYIVNAVGAFEPMNANFGILPPLDKKIKDKTEKKRALAERSLAAMREYIKEND